MELVGEATHREIIVQPTDEADDKASTRQEKDVTHGPWAAVLLCDEKRRQLTQG